MLTDKKVKAFVITSDPSAAKEFYAEKLGFKLLSEDSFGLEFEIHNALLRIAITQPEYATPQKHTVLGWCVPNIYEAVEALKGKGIAFEKYDFLNQDENNVWQAPGGTKVAWFKDPNGNVLSIDQSS